MGGVGILAGWLGDKLLYFFGDLMQDFGESVFFFWGKTRKNKVSIGNFGLKIFVASAETKAFIGSGL